MHVLHHQRFALEPGFPLPDALRHLPPHPIVIGSLLHHAAIARRIREELVLPNPIVTLNLSS